MLRRWTDRRLVVARDSVVDEVSVQMRSVVTYNATLAGISVIAACSALPHATATPTAVSIPIASQAVPVARDTTTGAKTNTIKTDSQGRKYTEADASFMQGMIAHHGQALEMSALVPRRSNRDDMRLMAQRIDESQRDEIAMMQRWLRARGEVAPEPNEHQHAGHEMLMPGMLSAVQMTELAQATGTKFDSLFLTRMIQHHQGALKMVADLFSTQGSGQDVDIFRFASDVDTDQTAEIDRMRLMLAAFRGRPQ
jgi:uncharacterized protein (DUF305 family)